MNSANIKIINEKADKLCFEKYESNNFVHLISYIIVVYGILLRDGMP